MKVKLYLRVKATWQTEQREMTPAELKPLRRQLRAALKARLAKTNDGKPEKDKRTVFAVTPVGEYHYGTASGTLTELTDAGICIGCLGNGRKSNGYIDGGMCHFCFGTGDYDTITDEYETKLRNRIEFLSQRRGNMTREDFIEFCLTQICCYGGDATVAILVHYTHVELKKELQRIITA